MKTKIKVYVTEDDIKNGVSRTYDKCPISQALLKLPDFNEVFVGSNQFTISYKDGSYYHGITLPRSAQRFIQRFDLGKPVKPFNFILDLEKYA